MNPEISVRTVEGDPLVDSYVKGDPALLEFFPGSPFEPASYRRKAEEVRQRFRPDALATMAKTIRPLSDGAATRLDAAARGVGFLVTTGQQPGLFGGPLYTLHKAISAIALARRLEDLLDLPVLPVFWVAADDHDWAEANHTFVLDPANDLRRLELAGPDDPPRSMGRRELGAAVEATLDELVQILPPSEFTPGLMDRLRAAYEPATTLADAFRETIAGLLEGLDLGLVDGQDRHIRDLGREVLARELAEPSRGEAALASRSARLEALGYSCQVPVLPGASNVFHEDEPGGRERLLRSGSEWVLRSSGRRFEDDELLALFDTEPERFSANVVLRPVVESAVFPTLAYVAGPGEVRYLAQTGELFAAHGVGMPIVFPRLSVTLIEGKVRKVLDKHGLDPAAFGRPVQELIAAVVRDDVPAALQESLARLRSTLQSAYEAVHEEARAIDPTLKGPIFGARNDALRAVSDVEKKIRQHVKLRQATDLEQIEKAAANLAPLGRPQERVINGHHYLARYGPELVAGILEAVETYLDQQWPAAPAAGPTAAR